MVLDGTKISNFVRCKNCCQLLCFFALNINSGGKVQTNTIKKHSAICSGTTMDVFNQRDDFIGCSPSRLSLNFTTDPKMREKATFDLVNESRPFLTDQNTE